MIKCKIFQENNDGLSDLEDKINNYFQDMENVKIVSVNTTVERVEGIDYTNIVILYI